MFFYLSPLCSVMFLGLVRVLASGEQVHLQGWGQRARGVQHPSAPRAVWFQPGEWVDARAGVSLPTRTQACVLEHPRPEVADRQDADLPIRWGGAWPPPAPQAPAQPQTKQETAKAGSEKGHFYILLARIPRC